MHTDFLGIQAFLAVVESGSFGLAAARLYLSQTAISHRMRKLEESLGAQLVVRTARGVALTPAGEALLPGARAALQALDDACDAVRRHGHDASRWVCFACVPTLAASVLVPLLQDFARDYPGTQLRVFDSSPGEIAELVAARTAAFGLTVARPVPEQLQLEEIAREPFVLVCPAGHRLADAAQVAWRELSGEPLIRISLPSGNSTTLDDALGELRDQVSWRWEAQRTATALEMVRAGMGITVVPALSVSPAQDLRVLPLVQPRIARGLALLTRRGESLAGHERALVQAATRSLRERLG